VRSPDLNHRCRPRVCAPDGALYSGSDTGAPRHRSASSRASPFPAAGTSYRPTGSPFGRTTLARCINVRLTTPYTLSAMAPSAFARPTSSRTTAVARYWILPDLDLAGITGTAYPKSPLWMSRRKTATATNPARAATPTSATAFASQRYQMEPPTLSTACTSATTFAPTSRGCVRRTTTGPHQPLWLARDQRPLSLPPERRQQRQGRPQLHPPPKHCIQSPPVNSPGTTPTH